jgi:photosystem II stability/assembly factor-like uncharacterized protein
MDPRRSLRSLASLLLATAVVLVHALPAAAQQDGSVTLDSAFLAGYGWRNLGPDRGGRSIAVSGVVGQREVAYFGAVGGGLWKTTDGGEEWAPVTDGWITSASVGAVAVSESDPDLVFIGTGETCIRGNILPGDGVYRSRDGGETWEHVGFGETQAISKIRVHPTDPDVVWVAVFGKYGAPSEERGVFKSTDGGDSWRKVLYRDARTGAIDVALDRTDPDVLYASLWEAYRKEYQMSSGGPGSGMFKSTDGGETWSEMTRNPGLPEEGVVGRIGLAVSTADPDRVYALFEHDEGGLFRSEDGGDTWTRVNDDRRIRQRAFYYTHVFADHRDPDVVYMQNTDLFRSDDGGETIEDIGGGTHGDFHDLWIDPDDPAHLVVGNDGGGAVTRDTGDAWTDQDFSTAQFYHVATTAHLPFHVCGAQQDNSTLCLPSDWNARRFDPRERGFSRRLTEGSMDGAYPVGGGEPGYIAPDPKDLNLFFSGANNGRYVDRYDRTLDMAWEVDPYPWFYSGEPSADMVERWQWTFPILFSPVDSTTLYVSSQRLWKSTDRGRSWERLSGDLTRADPSTLGPSGGPITRDMNGPEAYATIFSVGPGKVDMDVIWTGSDDGLVHVTRDGGDTWTDVTPPGMPDFGRVSQIDASAFDAGRAYVSVRLPLLDDLRPYVFRTDDYGATWTKIVNGIREDAYVNAVREDPRREGLLYAATNHGVYVSYDDGARWQELNPGFPDVPVVDLIVEEDALAIASHGRGFWVLDDVAPLRQLQAVTTSEPLVLFDPPTAYRSADGVVLSWWLAEEPEEATLEILDASGEVLRSVEREEPADSTEERDRRDRWADATIPAEAGLNHFRWDLRTEPWPSFPDMILWGVRTTAPTLPPGTYTVRLTADGRTATTGVTIAPNPWVPDVSVADMQAQYAFGRRIWEEVAEANRAVIAIRKAKVQVADRLERSDDSALERAARRLVENASEVESRIYQVKNRSNQDPLNFPIRVNNRLANLLSMLERGDGPPNEGMRDVFRIMSDRLRAHTDRLDEIWATDLEAVNRELERLGLEPVDPWDEDVELVPLA